MSKPVAVLISDVHYNLQTLPLADVAMRMAIDKANALNVPLVVAGDLHDTKANLRGECIKAMRLTMRKAKHKPFVLVGNHDKINEKSKDHALHFLGRLVHLVAEPQFTNDIAVNHMSLWMIPYQSEPTEFIKALSKIDSGSCIIAHQGCQGSQSGDYIQDKSAIPPALVSRFRVISGHYHTRQEITTLIHRPGCVGEWSYIGNPYTLTFNEAQDPPKGFQILMDNGTLEFVPTNLRKHLVYIVGAAAISEGAYEYMHPGINDLVWVKLDGTREELSKWTKTRVSEVLGLVNFRLDLIPLDTASNLKQASTLTQGPLLDSLIDKLQNTSDERKLRLKLTWKQLCE